MSENQSKLFKYLAVALATAGTFYWMWGKPINRKDLVKRIDRTYCSKITTPGYYCVSGYVQAEEPIYATKDQIPCVMWEEWEYAKGGGQAVRTGGKHLVFAVNDGTGRVMVNPDGAILEKQKVFFDNSRVPGNQNVKQVKGIEPGAQVTILGEVTLDGAGTATFTGPGQENYYCIARTTRAELEAEWSKDNYVLTFLKPGLAACAVAFLLYIFLIPQGDSGKSTSPRRRKAKR